MPFQNTQVPDLATFVPRDEFDPSRDRLVLITTAGERLVVQYETHRDRFTGNPEHGEQHYWVDPVRAPSSLTNLWMGHTETSVRNALGGVYVTVQPTSKLLQLTLASGGIWYGQLESDHQLESIVQESRPRRSKIALTDVSYRLKQRGEAGTHIRR